MGSSFMWTDKEIANLIRWGMEDIWMDSFGIHIPRVYNKYHKNAPKDAIYVGRPSKWGNPFMIGNLFDRVEAIERFRAHIASNPELRAEIKRDLRGKDLVCFCTPAPCHADVLLEIANSDD